MTVARNSMIGNPPKMLKFYWATEVHSDFKKSLNACIIQMWFIWSLRWREEVIEETGHGHLNGLPMPAGKAGQ